jgi:hypothetical protein
VLVAATVSVGFGLIVMEKVLGFPVHPATVEAIVKIPTVVAVTVGAVYPAIFVVPVDATPIAVLLFAQLNDAPADGVAVKLVAATAEPEHTV